MANFSPFFTFRRIQFFLRLKVLDIGAITGVFPEVIFFIEKQFYTFGPFI